MATLSEIINGIISIEIPNEELQQTLNFSNVSEITAEEKENFSSDRRIRRLLRVALVQFYYFHFQNTECPANLKGDIISIAENEKYEKTIESQVSFEKYYFTSLTVKQGEKLAELGLPLICHTDFKFTNHNHPAWFYNSYPVILCLPAKPTNAYTFINPEFQDWNKYFMLNPYCWFRLNNNRNVRIPISNLLKFFWDNDDGPFKIVLWDDKTPDMQNIKKKINNYFEIKNFINNKIELELAGNNYPTDQVVSLGGKDDYYIRGYMSENKKNLKPRRLKFYFNNFGRSCVRDDPFNATPGYNSDNYLLIENFIFKLGNVSSINERKNIYSTEAIETKIYACKEEEIEDKKKEPEKEIEKENEDEITDKFNKNLNFK